MTRFRWCTPNVAKLIPLYMDGLSIKPFIRLINSAVLVNTFQINSVPLNGNVQSEQAAVRYASAAQSALRVVWIELES